MKTYSQSSSKSALSGSSPSNWEQSQYSWQNSAKSVQSSSSRFTKCRLAALQNFLEAKLAETEATSSRMHRGVPPCKAIRELYWVREPGEKLLPGDRLGLLIWQYSMMKAARKLLAEHEKKQRQQMTNYQSSQCEDSLPTRFETVCSETPRSNAEVRQHQSEDFLHQQQCCWDLSQATPMPTDNENLCAQAHNIHINDDDDEYNLPSSDESSASSQRHGTLPSSLQFDRKPIEKFATIQQAATKTPLQRGCRFLCRRMLCHFGANFR
uniref:Uncharacterized protein n=1 Tax=Macrostomum lignano TaxID=282301 RepID=A0A1I8I3T3_9PLAT